MKTLIFIIIAHYGGDYPTPDMPRVMAKAESLEQCIFVATKLNELKNTTAVCVITEKGVEL